MSQYLSPRSIFGFFLSGVFAATTVCQPLAYAQELPHGSQIIAGQINIGVTGDNMLIEQSSQNAIVNWQGFSIGNASHVQFNNGNGATLNRVVGNGVSIIDGGLSATGSVYLINQNGIIVGKNGVINTGGSFIASTLDVSDADFLNGGGLTFVGASDTSIVNLGQVSSLGGDVAFISHRITNEGSISAPNGTAALIAGREVLMRDAALNDGKFVVKIGDANSSIVERGLIAAANVELRANGGNIYALAGNNGGSINATGVSTSGGRIFLTAGRGKLRVNKTLRAKTNNNGGNIFINANIVALSGLLDVTGNSGGNVDIGGSSSITLTNATVDASGANGGGQIRIGGEFQGGRNLSADEVQNVQNLNVDSASKLIANGTGANASGGTIINWSNNDTYFAGQISATGTAEGGFAEVSGKLILNYLGSTNLSSQNGSAGTLWLDPQDVLVDSTLAATIISDLANANVIISTSGTGAGNGKIDINSAIIYTSANSLTFLAHTDINANAAVQNSGTGDLTLIAGWDGSTAFNVTTYDAASNNLTNLAATTIFGNNNGSVNIGDRNQAVEISVGTRAGHARVYAYNLNLTGNSTSASVFARAQFGFNGAATSALSARLKNRLSARAGNVIRSFVQFGNGGYDSDFDHSGDIHIIAGDDLIFAGGRNFSHAQLGHGGNYSDGNHSGNITLLVGDDIIFTGNSYESSAYLGHGGDSAIGDHFGDINIKAGGNLRFTAGNRDFAYTQLGHGGYAASGNHSGDIDVEVGGYIKFLGNGEEAYAQLGHGDAALGYVFQSTGTRQGNINILALGELSFENGTNTAANYNYAWLGHATASANGISNANVNVTAKGFDLNVSSTIASGGLSVFSTAMLENALTGGNVSLMATDSSLSTNALLSYNSTHSLTLMASHNLEFNNFGIQNAGSGDITLVAGWDGSTGFNAGVFNAATLSTTNLFGNNNGNIVIRSVGGATIVGSSGGYTRAYGFNLGLYGTAIFSVPFGNVQLGYKGAATGAISARLKNSLIGAGGKSVQIGHSFGAQDVDLSGDIKIETLADIRFNSQLGSYHIGHGNVGGAGGTSVKYDGNITIISGNDILFTSHGGDQFAQIGHGVGNFARDNTGDINITAGGNLVFTAGSAYAQLGHGGGSGNHEGNINVEVGGDLSFKAGSGSKGYAQLGHGDVTFGSVTQATGTRRGNITINVDGELSFEDGTNSNLAWLGHGTRSLNAISNANLTVTAESFDLSVSSSVASGALGAFSGAMLDNALGGGNVTLMATDSGIEFTRQASAYNNGNNLLIMAAGNIEFNDFGVQNAGSGDLTLVAGWDGTTAFDVGVFDTATLASTNLFGNNNGSIIIGDGGQAGDLLIGSGVGHTRAYGFDLNLTDNNSNYALLGFMGLATGDISVRVKGDIEARGGKFVQIGHTFNGVQIDLSGDIKIEALGDLIFEAVGAFTHIGHGAVSYSPNPLSTLEGDITIVSAHDIIFTAAYGAAMIGHGGASLDAQSRGNIHIISAHDIIFTGRSVSNYAQIGHGGFVADGNHIGDIRLTNVHDIIFTGRNGGYAQLGHGGEDAAYDDVMSGNIDIFSANDIIFTGADRRGYAQLGHGGLWSIGDFSGDINIHSAQNIIFTAQDGYALLGHGGLDARGDFIGDINIYSAHNLTIIGGINEGFAQLGHHNKNHNANKMAQGDIHVNISSEFSLERLASANSAVAILGHYVATTNAISNANINITAASFDQSASSSVGSGGMSVFQAANLLNLLVGGDVSINMTDSNLSLDAALSYNESHQLLLSASHDFILDTGITITNTGGGDIIVAAGRDFRNNSGSITPLITSGRYLIYSADWDTIVKGGIVGGSNLYNRTLASHAPSSIAQAGNMFIYARLPILTITGTGGGKRVTYNGNGHTLDGGFVISTAGLVNGDTLTTAITSSPVWVAQVNAGVYTTGLISAVSYQGYGFNYVHGTLTIDPKLLTLSGVMANDKVYDGNIIASLGNYGLLVGIVGADNVSINIANISALFANAEAGSSKFLTIAGYELSGAMAGNYIVANPQGLTANITTSPINTPTGSYLNEPIADTVKTGAAGVITYKLCQPLPNAELNNLTACGNI